MKRLVYPLAIISILFFACTLSTTATPPVYSPRESNTYTGLSTWGNSFGLASSSNEMTGQSPWIIGTFVFVIALVWISHVDTTSVVISLKSGFCAHPMSEAQRNATHHVD